MEKIEAFEFSEVSWKLEKMKHLILVKFHENWRKLKHLIFVKFHEIWRKLKHFILGKFGAPGFMKIGGNWSIWFLWRGHENWRKFKHLIFCEVSCTRVHENFRKLKHFIYVKFCVPEVMKIGENWIIWILLILCTRVMKIGENWSIWFFWSFLWFSWPRVHKINKI